MKKNKVITLFLFLIGSVLILGACAEEANPDDLKEDYTEILSKKEKEKYEKGKSENLEKDKRYSFLDDEEFINNVEVMINSFQSSQDIANESYFINDELTYQYLVVEYEKEILKSKDAANYVQKYSTQKLEEKELDVVAEIKILAKFIYEYNEMVEKFLNEEKEYSKGKGTSIEVDDKQKRLNKQSVKTSSMYKKFLASKNLTVKEVHKNDFDFELLYEDMY